MRCAPTAGGDPIVAGIDDAGRVPLRPLRQRRDLPQGSTAETGRAIVWPARLRRRLHGLRRASAAAGVDRAAKGARPTDWHFVATRTVAGVLALAFGYQLLVAATNPLGVLHYGGADYSVYMEATRRFLAGGRLYEPFQVMYPPMALVLFVPFAFLPAVLWWVVPLGTIAYVAVRQCRTDWQRVALLASLVPFTLTPIATGNGSIWVAAAVVAANRWRWPSCLVLLKPTFAPWALIGIRSRTWWVGLGLLAVVSLALMPLWFEWARGLVAWHASPVWSAGSDQASRGEDYLTALLSPGLPLLWFATRTAGGRGARQSVGVRHSGTPEADQRACRAQD